MKLKEVCNYLDSCIPVSFQESYDNAGLQTGQPDREVHSALVAIDVTEAVVDEAIREGCDLVVSHHPLFFSPVKKLTGGTYVERIAMKAIKNDIAIYSAHTNLDSFEKGVSRKMAEKLSLRNVKVLSPLKQQLLKLVTYIPEAHFEAVTAAIFEAGAGVIGNYDNCGFSSEGTGTFRGNESSNPFAGEKGILSHEKELRFETILFSHLKNRVIDALIKAHPYE
jgi:dinuclear metal center YbgI/SA1388 family protein